ncbi:hypothetical protein [Mesobacillus zeae]|uniref:Uncharacterized protein n=1 Tax=Mesobacillus zeae TaxID=1917180 RepID=A0A398B751_9BACI|nr:hypothetical protein [Mesobacillus zeae]RID84648.1 hypothetical protein D1970_12220 [Mesobacillus zeae]
MGMCPLCNGFREVHPNCPDCGSGMEDNGREAEYYDDYSPYMPIDMMKLEDGYPKDMQDGECPHLFVCSECRAGRIMLIKE